MYEHFVKSCVIENLAQKKNKLKSLSKTCQPCGNENQIKHTKQLCKPICKHKRFDKYTFTEQSYKI